MMIYNNITALTFMCHMFVRAFFIISIHYSVFSYSASANAGANADEDIVVMIQPQLDLTVEEREILSQISNNASKPMDSHRNDDREQRQKIKHDDEHDQIISRVFQLIQNEKNELSNAQGEIGEYSVSLMRKADSIESTFKEIVHGAEELILKDIVSFNVRQLQILKERIEKSMDEELERRTMEPEIRIIEEEGEVEDNQPEEGELEDVSENSDDENGNDEVGYDLENKITKSELESILTQSMQKIIRTSEANLYEEIDEQLYDYIDTKIMPHQLNDFDRAVEQKMVELDQAEETLKSIVSEYEEGKTEGSCSSKSDVLNMVQSSIWKFDEDGGIFDHLLDGHATIVYGEEWTSSTYTQPPLPSPLDVDGSKKITLGDYQRYIPEDWERILPEGWADWDISTIHKFFRTDPRLHVPTLIWHSLPQPLTKLISPLGSPIISKPPETIMDKNVNLGSCWAMAGSSGRVTVRLERPLTVQSITIDHYPGILFSSHSEDGETVSSSSAPRFLRAVGYPPCKDEDRDSFDCIKYGFDTDTSASIDLGSFEYKPVPRVQSTSFSDGSNINGNYPRRSTQTFAVRSGALILDEDAGLVEENSAEKEEAEDSSDMFGGGSCSATKPSCGAVYDSNEVVELPPVAAVSIIIDENWGNEDFTCIYRVRVH